MSRIFFCLVSEAPGRPVGDVKAEIYHRFYSGSTGAPSSLGAGSMWIGVTAAGFLTLKNKQKTNTWMKNVFMLLLTSRAICTSKRGGRWEFDVGIVQYERSRWRLKFQWLYSYYFYFYFIWIFNRPKILYSRITVFSGL